MVTEDHQYGKEDTLSDVELLKLKHIGLFSIIIISSVSKKVFTFELLYSTKLLLEVGEINNSDHGIPSNLEQHQLLPKWHKDYQRFIHSQDLHKSPTYITSTIKVLNTTILLELP